jgi:hypothetical protein
MKAEEQTLKKTTKAAGFGFNELNLTGAKTAGAAFRN